MNHDPNKPTGLVPREEKSKSLAVMGADGETGFEGTDAPARVVIVSLGIVAALATFCFALIFGYDKFLESTHSTGELPSPLSPARVVPPAPQIQRLPWMDLPQLRAHEQQMLHFSGKDAAGQTHVPINEAMATVMARINEKPDAPQGLTTPGGQSRIFSHSLAEMPAAYQRPQIQGVIQGDSSKNAQ